MGEVAAVQTSEKEKGAWVEPREKRAQSRLYLAKTRLWKPRKVNLFQPRLR